MLPKTNRLNLTKERFIRGDAQVSERYFKLVVKKGMAGGPKVGFIVSSKVGKAVVRNKVRRTLSESVQRNLLSISKDNHLIFIAFPQASSAKKDEIEISVKKALSKI